MEDNSVSRISNLHQVVSSHLVETELENCTLKVLINAHKVCYCIVNEAQLTVALFDFSVDINSSQPYLSPNDLTYIFDTAPFLKHKFAHIYFAFQSAYHCTVANALNNDALTSKNFDLIVPPLPANQPYTVFVSNFIPNYSILQAFPNSTKRILTENFPEFELLSSHARFVQTVLEKHTIFSPKKMYLNLFENNVEVVIIDGITLIFANNFSFLNGKDFMFLILSTAKLYHFKFEEDEVFIGGFYNPKDSFYLQLSDYAHHLHHLSTPQNCTLAPEIAHTDSEMYFNLFCL